LDISGTNLAVINQETNEIEGLSLRSSQLEFLGLHKNDIPNSVISNAKKLKNSSYNRFL